MTVTPNRDPSIGDHDVPATLPTAQIGGRANSEKAPVAAPTAVSAAGDRTRAWHGLRGEYITRERKVDTYSAAYRLATITARNSLAFAQVANTDKQWATLHHAAGATKLVRIHRVSFVLTNNSAAAAIAIDLRRITTAPATGNPAITVMPHNLDNAATECTALALPTTAGTAAAGDSLSITELNAGVTVGATTFGANAGMYELFNVGDVGDSAQPIELRPLNLDGIAVIIRANAASTVNGYARIVWTEETP